ncbi:MAG: VOC family protein [Janthinobacterium lividum]
MALLCCGLSLASAQSTAPLRLASTRLVTNDAPGLAKFYGVVTQVAPVAPFGSGTYFEIRTPGGGVLAISDQASTAKYNANSAVAAQNRTSILEFEVKDVDAERRRLDGVVKTWVMEPYTALQGNRTMLFRDPDGNLINFYAVLPRKN